MFDTYKDTQYRDLLVGADAQELLDLGAQVNLVYLQVYPDSVSQTRTPYNLGWARLSDNAREVRFELTATG